MPTELVWEFFGEAQIARRLARVSIAARNVAPAWEVIAESFLAVERDQFDSQGSLSGGWAPLSEGYAAWKARHYPGKPILQRTGDLAASLTEGPEIRVIEASFMILGSAVPYGRYHQTGTPRMPRRRPVDIPEPVRRAWIKTVQRYLVTGGISSGLEL